jgi:uncharacterized membrane protein YjdF
MGIIDKEIPMIALTITSVLIILLPDIFRKKIHINEYIKFAYLLFMFFFLILGATVGMYKKVYFYDSIAHFITGVSTSLLSLFIMNKLKRYNEKDKWFNVIFIISFTMFIAGFWEMTEFTIDNIFNIDVQKVALTGVFDTMKDIILAFIGSILFSVYYVLSKKKNIINKIIE